VLTERGFKPPGKINDELVLKRLKHHHEISLFCTVGLEYSAVECEGVWIYPKQNAINGEDIFLDHYKDWNAQLYISCFDVWPISKVPIAAREGKINFVCWAFVDHEWSGGFMRDRLEPAIRVVPTSKWLFRRLRADGLKNITEPVYLGVDTSVYYPIVGLKDSAGELITKERLHRSLGFPPDSFLISIIQMNQLFRKPYEAQLDGISTFREWNPDAKVGVYIHAMPRTRNGWNLPDLVNEFGLTDVTRFANSYRMMLGIKGYNELHMAKIYSASDVILQATCGEATGLPVIESMACGVPVVATDFVGLSEMLEPTPELRVRIDRPFRAPQIPAIRKVLPDPYSIAEKLEIVYNRGWEYYQKRCSEFASQFTWDRCLEGWLKVLSEVEDEMDRRCLGKPPAPSEELKVLSRQIRVIS